MGEGDADQRVDSSFVQGRRCGGSHRRRPELDRSCRVERNRFDAHDRRVRTRQLTKVTRPCQQRYRIGGHGARLLEPIKRPEGAGEDRACAATGDPVAQGVSQGDGLFCRGPRIVEAPGEIDVPCVPDQQVDAGLRWQLGAQPQGPVELQAGLQKRPDPHRFGGGQQRVAARKIPEARRLRMVSDPRVVRPIPLRQHPRDLTVQSRTPAGGQRLRDRLSRRLVSEAERWRRPARQSRSGSQQWSPTPNAVF